jgi:hypothetical protein
MRSLLTFLVTLGALRPRAYYRENKAISLLFHKSNPEEVHDEHLLSSIADFAKSAIVDKERTMSGPHGGTAKQFVE